MWYGQFAEGGCFKQGLITTQISLNMSEYPLTPFIYEIHFDLSNYKKFVTKVFFPFGGVEV